MESVNRSDICYCHSKRLKIMLGNKIIDQLLEFKYVSVLRICYLRPQKGCGNKTTILQLNKLHY